METLPSRDSNKLVTEAQRAMSNLRFTWYELYKHLMPISHHEGEGVESLPSGMLFASNEQIAQRAQSQNISVLFGERNVESKAVIQNDIVTRMYAGAGEEMLEQFIKSITKANAIKSAHRVEQKMNKGQNIRDLIRTQYILDQPVKDIDVLARLTTTIIDHLEKQSGFRYVGIKTEVKPSGYSCIYLNFEDEQNSEIKMEFKINTLICTDNAEREHDFYESRQKIATEIFEQIKSKYNCLNADKFFEKLSWQSREAIDRNLNNPINYLLNMFDKRLVEEINKNEDLRELFSRFFANIKGVIAKYKKMEPVLRDSGDCSALTQYIATHQKTKYTRQLEELRDRYEQKR